jgi:hypothetical protein
LYWCVTDHHLPTLIPKKKADGEKEKPREFKPPHEINPRIPMPLSRLIVDCVQNRPSHRPPDFNTVIPRLELALTVTKADATVNESTDEMAPAIPASKDATKDSESL